MWRFAEPQAEGKKVKKSESKTTRPSEINHGNVTPSITDPDTGPGGVTFREAVQTTVLSLTQIRKLRFPDGKGATSVDRDIAGRAVIGALGILAVTLHQEDGYQLRSRCQLVPVEPPKFELIGRTERNREAFDLDSGAAELALNSALDAAGKRGLTWHPGKIELQPRPDLLKLVAYSDHSVSGAEGE